MIRQPFSVLLATSLFAAFICANDSCAQAPLIAPAEVVSRQDITIGPPNIRRMWNYKIQYLAAENTKVKAGEVLVKFDGDRQRQELVDFKSKLEAALKQKEKAVLEDAAKEQELILAVAEAKKNRDIAKQKADIVDVSRSDIERRKQLAELNISLTLLKHAEQKLAQHKVLSQLNLEVQEARIAKARAKVNQTQDAIKKLQVYAPADGIVTYVSDWENNKPAVGETEYMGRMLMRLPSLDKLAVIVEIDESDIAKIKVGQAVRVVLDEHPEKAFSGTLSEIGRTFKARSQWDQKIIINAWVTLDAPDKTIMRPGMKANVEFI